MDRNKREGSRNPSRYEELVLKVGWSEPGGLRGGIEVYVYTIHPSATKHRHNVPLTSGTHPTLRLNPFPSHNPLFFRNKVLTLLFLLHPDVLPSSRYYESGSLPTGGSVNNSIPGRRVVGDDSPWGTPHVRV